MCKRWCVLCLIFLLPGSVEMAGGQTIAHWQFSGTAGQPMDTDTDVAGGHVAKKFYDVAYVSDPATDVFYGPANPLYNASGTSADFLNDPAASPLGGNLDINVGVGLFVSDTGVDTPLDLSTFGAFTIEAFIYPYSLRQSVIVRKYGGSPGQYYVDLKSDGGLHFSINSDANAAMAPAASISMGDWHHVAAVFDEADAAEPMRLYINGELAATATHRARPGDSPRSLGIGCIVRDNLAPPGNTGQFFHGRIDEVRISAAGLAVEDFLLYAVDGAGRPNPADGATDLPPYAVLSWASSRASESHDVYLGTSLEEVESATLGNPLGVLVSQGQTAGVYEPTTLLEIGQTYYWRVDTHLRADDGAGTVLMPGQVWSFTVEPYSYPVEHVTATASSAQDADTGPEKTIDGSGLSDADLHSTNANDMWLSEVVAPGESAWIQYEFSRPLKLDEMWVWNQNQVVESSIGFGAKDVTIEHSIDGQTWVTLGQFELARAPGSGMYAANTTVDFAGEAARYVRLVIHSNWGGILPQYGLSEVRFFHIPVSAREPKPDSGAAGVEPNTSLSWRSGREAVLHEVYLSDDELAVVNGTALAGTVAVNAFEPADLKLRTTYYWKVDQVNETADPSIWGGDLWSFTTKDFLAIDDFEGYTDEEGGRIYESWVDGWENDTGSTVGYLEAPFAERRIVHNGRQSMPLDYDNTESPWYSEAQRTFGAPQDWTVHGADTLRVHFRGNPIAFLQPEDGTILLSAAGADIWEMADEFRFAYKPLTGDGSIVARVDSVGNTHAWAKAGVMIRESLDLGSKFAAVYLTPGNGGRFQVRSAFPSNAVGDDTVATPEQIAIRAPHWIKLERSGDTFRGSYSADGKSWTPMAWSPQTVTMQSNVYIGLALTSHNVNTPTHAAFSQVEMTGGISGPWQNKAIGFDQRTNDPTPLYVVLEDTAGRTAVVTHPDEAAVGLDSWMAWEIPLAEFASAGVDVAQIRAMSIGVGDRDNPTAGGSGLLYIDDIEFGRSPEAPVATIAHWQFHGEPGDILESDIDVAGDHVARKFYDATYGANAATDIFYGPSNPGYGQDGSSAEFVNDPTSNDPGVGLFVPDAGVDTPLDLSTLGAFTIEAFIHPYAVRQSVIVRKWGGSGRWYIDLSSAGAVNFAINADGNSAASSAGAISENEWHHIAAVFDETDLLAPMRIYVNGELKGTNAYRGRPVDSTNSLGIGCITRDNLDPPGNSGQFFHGRIDQLRISAAALSVEEFLLNPQP